MTERLLCGHTEVSELDRDTCRFSDVCSVLTVLSSTPLSFFSLLSSSAPTLLQSLFHAHSLPLCLLLIGPLKIGQSLCKEESLRAEEKRMKQSLVKGSA